MATAKSTCKCEICKAHPRSTEAAEHRKVLRAIAGLDEKHARRVVGLLASMKGHGGNTLLSTITGMSRTTFLQGRRGGGTSLSTTGPILVGDLPRPLGQP